MKATPTDGERSLAVFIDFENMGLGFNNRRDRFEINKVLERLVEKGKIVAKKAYADWSRFGAYTGALHEAAIELVEIPRRGMSGKNSADIRLVVDAIDLAYSKDHIDTFVIVSGDSDFSPLVSKLKELGKHVIGLGLADATSDLLRDNCDEFIYYEDLDRAPIIPVAGNESIPEKKRKVFALLLDSLLALRRENKEVLFSSMVKDTMKRKKPSFNEDYYGYRTFSELLEDAQKEGLVEIEKHRTSGMYVVSRFGLEMKGGFRFRRHCRRNGRIRRTEQRRWPRFGPPGSAANTWPPTAAASPHLRCEERPPQQRSRPPRPSRSPHGRPWSGPSARSWWTTWTIWTCSRLTAGRSRFRPRLRSRPSSGVRPRRRRHRRRSRLQKNRSAAARPLPLRNARHRHRRLRLHLRHPSGRPWMKMTSEPDWTEPPAACSR
ncbi:MAG: NYN domain-containing protein [Gemmataceae bacterium]